MMSEREWLSRFCSRECRLVLFSLALDSDLPDVHEWHTVD